MTTKRAAPGRGGLILCVEDEPDLRADIIEELRASGHEAIGADDGRGALEILKNVRPDLILCDISMPGMNGYELLDLVRTRRGDLDDVPFVFLTALNERAEVISGKRAGADDYLVKPIDFDLMLASIEARIAQARRIRAQHREREEAAGSAFGSLLNGMTTEVLDLLSFGVVLADGEGQVAFANAFARTLEAEGGGLCLRGGLRAGTAEETRQLRAIVAQTVEAAERGEDRMQGMTLRGGEGAGEVMLVICSLPGREAGEGRPAMSAIFLADATRRPEPPEHMLASLFGLTPAEAQVAHRLVRGRRSADIASDLGISQTTVAFHLRNLFEKTGTRRQVDLVALIMRSFAVLR